MGSWILMPVSEWQCPNSSAEQDSIEYSVNNISMRRFQFSLRTLFLVTIVAAVISVVAAPVVRQAIRERKHPALVNVCYGSGCNPTLTYFNTALEWEWANMPDGPEKIEASE